MIRILILIALGCFFSVGTATAQSEEDRKMIQQLIQKAEEVKEVSHDSALQIIQRAELMARNFGFEDEVHEALSIQGFIYQRMGRLDEALDFHLNVLDYNKKSGKESKLIGSYNDVGMLFFDIGNHEKARSYLKKAVELSKKRKEYAGVKLSLMNMGITYADEGDLDTGLAYFKEAADVQIPEEGIIMRDIFIMNNMGNLYRIKGELDKAESYLLKALEYAEGFDLLRFEGYCYNNLSNIYLQQSELNRALSTARKAHEIGLQNGDVTLIEQTQESLIRIFKAQQDYQSAMEQLERFVTFKDSLDSTMQKETVYQLETKYQVEKNKKELAEAKAASLVEKNNKQRWIGLSGGLLLLAASGFIITRMRHKKRIAEKNSELAVQQLKINQQEKELEQYKQHLLEYTNDLIRKNKQIASAEPIGGDEQVDEALLSNKILTSEDWKEYRTRYERVYPGYFKKLMENMPNLTEAEQRISALIRLGLNNHEMADMLGISEGGVRKTIYRIRKKFELEDTPALKEKLVEIAW